MVVVLHSHSTPGLGRLARREAFLLHYAAGRVQSLRFSEGCQKAIEIISKVSRRIGNRSRILPLKNGFIREANGQSMSHVENGVIYVS